MRERSGVVWHVANRALDVGAPLPPRELGGILIEVVRRSLRGASKVADHLDAAR